MARCSTMLLACLALLGVERLGAQTQVHTLLRATVEPTVALERAPASGVAVPRGEYTEYRGAAVLRISANCAWRLVAVSSAPVSARLRGDAEGGAFLPVEAGAAIATGTRGRSIELVIDYRVSSEAAMPRVEYRVEPLESSRLTLASATTRS